ncbi:hypothetical protein BGP78_18330 [Pseudoalteromonas sp. MSK9-3]|uniref:tandem-95 repeat protein n=1 Tax=Pseudoalteromonas sp. MSK9-3 TaxID=1897633 RepID=UPI000EDB6F03|nr:Ig-like domain-containing protein [Pseudoalteromonas sp. MSK9-3]RJE73577.1 hypothetical protein BGP78_18330 [Pseudoalteromonas sp. MSK9-3]
MTIKRRGWIAALFTLITTKKCVQPRILKNPPIFFSLLFGCFQVQALECERVEETTYTPGSGLSCHSAELNDPISYISYHRITGDLVNQFNIDGDIPEKLHAGETYTFTNNLSSQSPKQTFTAKWHGTGWENISFIPPSPIDHSEPQPLRLSSNYIPIGSSTFLTIDSDSLKHTLTPGIFNNDLFRITANNQLELINSHDISSGEYIVSITTLDWYENPKESTEVTISVGEDPYFAGEPSTVIYLHNSYAFLPKVIHRNHDQYTYKYYIRNKPSWASFDTNTGQLMGHPTKNDIGTTEPITISMTNGKKTYSLEPFNITIKNINRFFSTSILPTSSYSGLPFNIDITNTGTSYETDFTYRLIDAPLWFTINSDTGRITGTPPPSFSGTVPKFTVSATDGYSTYKTPVEGLYVHENSPNQLHLNQSKALTFIATPYEEGNLYDFFDISEDERHKFKIVYFNQVVDSLDSLLTLQSDGSFNYSYYGSNVQTTASFQFAFISESKSSPIFTATINAFKDSDNVVTMSDDVFLEEDVPTIIDVLKNDENTDTNLIRDSLEIEFQPENGVVVIENGKVLYTPKPNFYGKDHFQYSISPPPSGKKILGSVNIDVNFNNDFPIIAPHTTKLLEDGISTSVPLRTLTSDAEDGVPAGAISIISSPTKGAMSFNLQDESIVYTPRANETGIDTLSFTVTDNFGAVSEPGIITFDIEAVNDTPIAQNDTLTTLEDAIKELNILENDSDIEDETFTAENITLEDQGQGTGIYPLANVTVTPAGNLSVNPTPNASGAFSFTYMVTDSGGNTSQPATVNVLIEAVNDVPSADSKKVEAIEEQPIAITLTASDIEQSPLTYKIISVPKSGNLTIINDVVTYTGNLNFSGADSFTYAAFDQTSWSTPATVNINVANVQDLPLISGSPATNVKQDQLYDFTPTASDVDNDVLSFTINNMPSWLSFNASTGQLAGTPSNDDVNTYTNIAIKVFDGTGYTALTPFSIEVINVNDAPALAGTPAASVNEDVLYSFTPSLTDVDLDDSHTFSIENSPVWATFNTASGLLSGTPTNKHVGSTENIIMSVTDKAGEKATLPTFSIAVSNINDAPQLTGTPPSSVAQDSPYTFTPTLSDIDVDDSHTFAIQSAPEWATFNTESGTLSGTPLNEHVGSTANIIISVLDKAGEKATLPAFAIEVTNVNDAPTLTGTPTTEVTEDNMYHFLPTLTDPDVGDDHTFSIINKPEWADFDTSNGAITGTPLDQHVGLTENIIISVNDNIADSPSVSLAPFSIKITNSPDFPSAKTFSFTLNEEEILAIEEKHGLLSTATDDDIDSGDILTAHLMDNVEHGTLLLKSNGAFTYQHDGSETIKDTFTYFVKDSTNHPSTIETVTLTINPVDDAPIAKNDEASTQEDTPVTFSLIGNDTDAEQKLVAASAILVTEPKFGSVSITNGIATYTPNEHANGPDSFTYTVSDSTPLTSEPATVNIAVSAVNDAPKAVNISKMTDEDTDLVISIDDIRNQASDIEDTNPTGDIKLTSEPIHGLVTRNQADGTLTYIPDLNVVATDTFKYTIADSNGEVSNEATMSINIGAINDRPIVENDSAQTDEDTSLTLDILHNDSDVEDQGFNGANITLEDQGKGEGVFDLASVTVNADGQLYIAPARDAVGELAFTYVLTDSEALASVPATVNVTIKPVNDAPMAENNTATVQEDGSFEINILGNDTDVDANDKLDADSVTLVDVAEYGTVSISEAGTATYTPNENFSGTDSFTYTVKDIAGAISNKAEVLVTVEAVNDAPVATPSATTVAEDGRIDITLTGTDIEKSALTYKISTPPSNGVLTPVSGVVWSYTPTANFNGTDSIAFIANDGELDSETAQVAITVTAVNDAPNAQNVSATTEEETSVSMTLNGSDIDGDNVSFIITNQPSNGTATLSGGQVNYTPNDDFTGTDSFGYQANDGSLTSQTAVADIQVNNVNDAPNIAGTPATTVRQGNTYTFTPSVTDIDSTQFSYTIANKPTWANFDSTTGTLSGTPARGDVGISNNIVITVSDQELTASLPAFAIEVSFTNTPPRAQAQTISVQEDGTTSFIPTINDIDGDTLSIEIVTQPNAGTASVQGNILTYTPNTNYHGADALTYIVDDGTEQSSETRIAINVVSVNDMPQANPDTFTFDGNDANRYVLDVLSNDTDLDEQPLTIVGAQASIGSVTVENNQLVYQAPTLASTTVTIDYVIADPEQARSASHAVLSITSLQTGLPEITAPADISVNATGLFTKVELGVATATDSQGNTLAVSLVDNTRIFAPGNHLVYWQTQDSQERTAMASHTVTVNPLISIDQGFTVSEGSSNTVTVQLNGDAPSYPVTIPYTVSGSAIAADHTLESGEVIITSGRSGSITFEVFQDAQQEESEAIIITLSNEVNVDTSSNIATISIEEGNIAPQITTTITQQGENRTLVAADQGEVSLLATVSDANSNDQLQVSWTSADPRISNTSATDTEFTFSPAQLPAGIYSITASVTDNATPALTASQEVYIEVIAQLAALTSQDSDGDLIPDNEEGYADSDGDGIPDYQDAISQPNVLQGSAGNSTGHLIEAQAGTSLRKGTSVAQNSSGGAQLLSSELPSDDTAQNVGGLYDFIASGLMNAGDTFTIVLPQYEQVPLNAVYRKYKNGEWVNFSLGGGNTVMSAQGESGYCPAANSSQWRDGLNAGDWCIKLQIVDGGPNDDDGIANKTVVDPSGMAIVLNGNTLPVTIDDTFTVKAGNRIQLNVLHNDTDADGDTLSVVNATSDIGTTELEGGLVYFTAPENLSGTAQLTYMVADTQGGSASGHAAITITANTAPQAVNDAAATLDTQTLDIDVLSNDQDSDGDVLNIIEATVDEGSVSITGNNTLRYTPDVGFSGIATIQYTISDSDGASDVGQVAVTVTLDSSNAVTPTPTPTPAKKSSGTFGLFMLILILGGVTRRYKYKV